MKAVIQANIYPAYMEKFSWIFDEIEGLRVLEDETIDILEENSDLIEKGVLNLYWDQLVTFESK